MCLLPSPLSHQGGGEIGGTEEHKGKSCGLCANYNAIQSDDFIIQQGEQVEEKKWVGTSEVFFLH